MNSFQQTYMTHSNARILNTREYYFKLYKINYKFIQAMHIASIVRPGNKTFRPQDVSPLAVSPLFSTLVVSPPIP